MTINNCTGHHYGPPKPRPPVMPTATPALQPRTLWLLGKPVIRLALAFPPTLNSYYRYVPGHGPKISAAGRDYRKGVAGEVFLQVTSEGPPPQLPLKAPLWMTVDLWKPDRRKRDSDNYFKALLDSLQHAGVYEDDSQVLDLHSRIVDPKYVMTEVAPADAGCEVRIGLVLGLREE